MNRRAFSIGITALLLFGGVFGLLPTLAVRLNDVLSLPRWQHLPLQVLGVGLILAAVSTYVYCAMLFASRGTGTPSPLKPTQRLVTSGVFSYSRNPIYVGYVGFLLGLFLVFGHLTLLVYAMLVAAFIHLLLVLWEEPDLRRRFGSEYDSYCQAVSRWVGRRRDPNMEGAS